MDSSLILIIVDGLAYGLQLSLLAVGITLVFGLGEILNIAQGEFAVITGIVTVFLIGSAVPIPLAVLMGIAVSGLTGLVIDRTILRQVYKKEGEARITMGIFVTLGLFFVMDNVIANNFALSQFSVQLPIGGIRLFGVSLISSTILAAFISACVILTLYCFLRLTFLGKAIRAIAQTDIGAQICGIKLSRIRTIIFVLGTTMAGFGGAMVGLSATLDPASGLDLTGSALLVSVVGGVRSVNGAIASGVLLGLVNTFASFFFGGYVTSIIIEVAAILTILVRPEGILGLRT